MDSGEIKSQEGTRRAYVLKMIARRRPVQRELHVVGEKEPITAQLILQRQRFRLELDPVVARKVRPDIDFCRLLLVGMAELEDDFRIAHRLRTGPAA
jgi:hypothetical protein